MVEGGWVTAKEAADSVKGMEGEETDLGKASEAEVTDSGMVVATG